MIYLDALIVRMLFFIQLFLQGIAWRVAITHFLHAERGNAAAAAFNGAFGEDIADCHTEDDNDKNAESKEEGFHVCIPED
mgnify:CR=1 FL=1